MAGFSHRFTSCINHVPVFSNQLTAMAANLHAAKKSIVDMPFVMFAELGLYTCHMATDWHYIKVIYANGRMADNLSINWPIQ